MFSEFPPTDRLIPVRWDHASGLVGKIDGDENCFPLLAGHNWDLRGLALFWIR